MIGVTRPARRRNRVLVHQMLDEHSSARAHLSTHEAQVVLYDVAERVHAVRKLRPHDQSLHAPTATDSRMCARCQNRFQSAKENGCCTPRNVKSGNEALTIVPRMKRMDATGKRELEVKVVGLGCMTLQHGEGDV